jgi:hypothetical protein
MHLACISYFSPHQLNVVWRRRAIFTVFSHKIRKSFSEEKKKENWLSVISRNQTLRIYTYLQSRLGLLSETNKTSGYFFLLLFFGAFEQNKQRK